MDLSSFEMDQQADTLKFIEQIESRKTMIGNQDSNNN